MVNHGVTINGASARALDVSASMIQTPGHTSQHPSSSSGKVHGIVKM